MGVFVDMLALQIKEREQVRKWCRVLPRCQMCKEKNATFFDYPVPGASLQDICGDCRGVVLAEVYGERSRRIRGRRTLH